MEWVGTRDGLPVVWRSPAQERRQAALLDAAERLIAEKGLLGAGLQEIGAAIGLAPYAVRAQFGSREMVIEAVMERHVLRLIDSLESFLTATEELPAEARLEAAITSLFELMGAHADGQRVHAAVMHGASPQLVRRLKLRQRHLAHVFAGLIAAAVPEAAGRSELAMPAAMSLLGMACWHVLSFRERGALARGDYARLVAHMLTDGVRAAAAAGVGGWEDG